MIVGEIYYWVTDRAIGHQFRPKYHVYVCEGNWREQGQAFLFINSSNYTGADYGVHQADYPFFTNETSYIGCSALTVYPDEDLYRFRPQRRGRLTTAHLKELRDAIARSDFMEGWQIRMVCEALNAAL